MTSWAWDQLKSQAKTFRIVRAAGFENKNKFMTRILVWNEKFLRLTGQDARVFQFSTKEKKVMEKVNFIKKHRLKFEPFT